MEPLSISQIFSGASKLMENAQELIEEAALLLQHHKYPRAFALAHLACEELIKCIGLFPVAVEIARGHRVDWRAIDQRLRDHRVKIRGSLLLDFLREPAPEGGYQASELAQSLSAAEDLNNLKNESLYTSLIGDTFFKPAERIVPQVAAACVAHAREQLQISQTMYSAFSSLTGMTEEGLRSLVEGPELQALFQILGNATDLSTLPRVDQTRALAEMTAVFNHPDLQPLLFAPLPAAIAQVLQTNQAEDTSQSEEPTRQDDQGTT